MARKKNKCALKKKAQIKTFCRAVAIFYTGSPIFLSPCLMQTPAVSCAKSSSLFLLCLLPTLAVIYTWFPISLSPRLMPAPAFLLPCLMPIPAIFYTRYLTLSSSCPMPALTFSSPCSVSPAFRTLKQSLSNKPWPHVSTSSTQPLHLFSILGLYKLTDNNICKWSFDKIFINSYTCSQSYLRRVWLELCRVQIPCSSQIKPILAVGALWF